MRQRALVRFVPYEYFEHTADIGIRAWGATLDEAFGQAAIGLVANMVDLSQAKPVGEVRIDLEAENVERLLFHFLDEVLDIFYARMWVFTDARVHLEGDTRLSASLLGEAYEAERHGHVHEIKAMTYHGLQVQRSPPEIKVIVDI